MDPQAKSGNKLVDDFITYYSFHKKLSYEQQSLNNHGWLVVELRSEARKIVDKRMTDRKKQIVMLLHSGKNQSETANHLGIQRQAISKMLNTIPDEYRLDVILKTKKIITTSI